jgi:cobalt-zinc-cadmium efflux system outer membrane protein
MRIGSCAVAVCAVLCLHAEARVADAQARVLTLAEILTRAREQAPQIVSARLTVEETRSRLLGASLRFQSNPEIDGSVGTRQATGSRFTDFEIGLSQRVEPGSRRSARIAGADAAIAQSSADVDEITRVVLRSAASAYYRAVHANLRIRLLNATHELAVGVYSVADRRFRAGDIAVLDVNIARASLARVRAAREAAESAKALALGDLKQLVRLDEDVAVEGEIGHPPEADLTTALQTALQRPELRALEAAVQEAEAQARLGDAYAKPDYGFGLRYSREEGDQIVLGGMTVALPVLSKGQEQRAVGTARAARLRTELDATRTRVRLEVRSAFEAYTRRLAAVRVLETEAIPGLDENETLTTRSFEVGQLGLPELLLIRREIVDTRSQYLDALLEAALARIDLDASAAILR